MIAKELSDCQELCSMKTIWYQAINYDVVQSGHEGPPYLQVHTHFKHKRLSLLYAHVPSYKGK